MKKLSKILFVLFGIFVLIGSLVYIVISLEEDQAPEESSAATSDTDYYYLQSVENITKVYSGVNVGFDFKIIHDTQYIAFYDKNRYMTVGQKKPGASWAFTKLDNRIKSDSHNYVTLEIDSAGYIHVSGNMHNDNLKYYRSTAPYSVSNFNKKSMTGIKENEVTYPSFLKNNNQLFFFYRHGESGNGKWYINAYNTATKSWRKLSDNPLFADKEQSTGSNVNAYYLPFQSKDGYYHAVWSWRKNYLPISSFDIHYAKTRDFKTWYNYKNESVYPPFYPESNTVILDTPTQTGLFNGRIHFTMASGYPVIFYHKYNDQGNSAMYGIVYTNNAWQEKKLREWDFRWDLEQGGSIPSEITVWGPILRNDGNVQIQIFATNDPNDDRRRFRYDADDLSFLGYYETDFRVLDDNAAITTPEGTDERLERRVSWNEAGNDLYVYKWETLPSNNDQPYANIPAPSTLLLAKYSKNIATPTTIATTRKTTILTRPEDKNSTTRHSTLIETENDLCGTRDANNDGELTIIDFSVFIKYFGRECTIRPSVSGCGPKDGNGDGKIDYTDFELFKEQYKSPCR